MKYINNLIIGVVIFSSCSLLPQKEEQSKVNTDSIPEMSEKELISEIPSVEDTIRYQLGEKLYFSDNVPPTDSITVIGTNHRNYDTYGRYLEYKFIVHNTHSVYHKKFSNASLDKRYKSYLEAGNDNHDAKFREAYDKSIESQRKEVENVLIDEAIEKYTGYWIYLIKYNNQFYLDDTWDWTYSFHLSNNIITRHYMDGIYPYFIEFFERKTDGDLQLKTTQEETIINYKLINDSLNIFQIDNIYIAPAKNIHYFEIIEYTNNTGDLM